MNTHPFPDVESILPAVEDIRPIKRLRSELRRIDGWGSLAWKEILGAWRLSAQAIIVICVPEQDDDADVDERLAFLVVDHGLGKPASHGDAVAMADWVLRVPVSALLAKPAIHAWTLRPGQAVRATNACWFAAHQLVVRLHLTLPYAGMGIDPRRVGRFIAQVSCLADALAAATPRPGLAAHRRSVAKQQALRAALPANGLVAFISEGAVVPRAGGGGLSGSGLSGGGPAARATPIRLPATMRTRLSLGRFGTVRGWGLREGVTAITGSPYHGKSTVLQALQAGVDDHPPGDGREGIATIPGALLVQAEDGRPVSSTDLSLFFATLPGTDPQTFATARASGATSMAASVVQGIAAGSRLLLIDEDSAASNFLLIDPVMRKLLGPTLRGTTTLLEVLPAFATMGVSTILVAGSSGHSLAVADRVVQMDQWQPHDVTTRARRLVRRLPPSAPLELPRRWFADVPDALFGPRHFAPLDLREPERPRIKLPVSNGVDGWHRLDLRRSGWVLDEALTAGALLAAGWVCRLARGGAEMAALESAYASLIANGPTALDPFHSRMLTVPPWQLVVSVLERMPVRIRSLSFASFLTSHFVP